MIRMGMGFQYPRNRQILLARGCQNPVGRTGRGLSAAVVVVEHRVDHGGLPRRGIGHQIRHRVGGLIEEGLSLGGRMHGAPFCRMLFERLLAYAKLAFH